MRELGILRFVTVALILIFLAIFINIEVSRLRIENKELMKKINELEEEKLAYEGLFLKKITLYELENKAQEIGLQYPQNILEVKIENGILTKLRKERYFVSSYKDYSFKKP